MNKINRRSFMKGLAGVVAALGLTSKAEEPKYKVGCDPGTKSGLKSIDLNTVPNFITKEYDLIADLVEEMNKFDKKLPDTRITYSIHCNYTGLAFLNDTGGLDNDRGEVYGYAMRHGYTHLLWIPYTQWIRMVFMNVMVRPNLNQDIGLMAHYSTRRNILNKLENVWSLVTTRCFNVNRDEEGQKIAMGGWRPSAGIDQNSTWANEPLGIMGAIKGNPKHLQAYCKEAISKGQMTVIEKVDDYGNIWVKPITDFYKNG